MHKFCPSFILARLQGLALLLLTALASVSAQAKVIYVSVTGDDEHEGTSTQPYATIAKAIGEAQAGDEIWVTGGVYTEALVSTVERLTISGSWTSDFWTRDLVNCRTVIKSPNKSNQDCFKADGVLTHLDGVDLTGGRYGIWTTLKYKSDYTTNHHLLTSCVISNNTTGASDGGSDYAYGFVFRSCLFANNATGFSGYNNNGPYKYFYNCTFADNTTALARGSNSWAPICYFKNCLLVRNGTAVSLASGPGMAYLVRFYANGWFGNTKNVTLTNWQNESGCSGFGRGAYLGPQYYVDPKLDAEGRPQAGSPVIGLGVDLSDDSVESVTVDLYGASWDGVYDFGCVKATAPAAAKLDEVYVATTGDDANSGASEDAAKRTVSAALAVLAPNGVCHVADGTYVGSVSVGVTGAKVVGASREGVVLKPSEEGPSASLCDFALAIAADNVSVSNMTLTCGGVGLYLPNWQYVKNAHVENVSMSGNRHGYWCCSESDYGDARTGTYFNRLSHCVIRDNTGYGALFRFATRVDNTLVADNGSAGFYVDGWNCNEEGDSWAKCGISLVNVTMTGNTYGYFQNETNYSSYQYFANCIFEGNSVAGIQASNNAKLYSCDFWNNGTDVKAAKATPVLTDARYVGPLLDATAKLRGHLLANSPCAQTGTNLADKVTTMPEAFGSDLDYVKRIADKIDLGCYDSPETLDDLAGDGYHILAVSGSPDGYGTPSPDYGRNLLRDGPQTLSVAETLTTDPLDNVRCVPLAEGVRAAYRGYSYASQAQGAQPQESASGESLEVNIDANATWAIRWEVQNLVVASTDPDGGTVRINDGPAAACVSNWVAQGETCTVTFQPATDYVFDSWSGTEPGEGSSATITVGSSAPRLLVAASQKLIHVAKSGDDGTGDGTSAKPFLTIARAVSIARPRDIIKVQGGVYEEAVVNTAVDDLTFFGGYDATWRRDLRNAETVVCPNDAAKHGFQLTRVSRNTVDGFVIRGANAGVYATGPSDQPAGVDRIRCLHHVRHVVVSNCMNGVSTDDGWCGLRVYASLMAHNSKNGIRLNINNRCAQSVHNVTLVGNGEYGLFLGWNAHSFEVRNTVFADNTLGGIVLDGNSSSLGLWNCLFDEPNRSVYLKNATFTAYPASGLLFLPAQLGEDFAPLTGSPCAGSGMSLAGHPLYESDGDLYGTPWNGVYDIGCLKASGVVAKLPDVYVSPTGDDVNDGATAERPMRTAQLAERRVAAGGTLHLAAGEYEGPLALMTERMTLAGAGRDQTVVKGGAGLADDYKSRLGVQIAAHDVVVRDLSVTGSKGSGIQLGLQCAATNECVERCEIKGNATGVGYASFPNGGLLVQQCCDVWQTQLAKPRFTHCVISNNTGSGVSVTGRGYCGPVFDNTLVVRNGSHGLWLYDYRANGAGGDAYLAYCTIADNGGTGISTAADNNSSYVHATDCVICGNQEGVHGMSWGPVDVDHSVVSGNGTDFVGTGTRSANSSDPICFSAANAYHLRLSSPARGLARALKASDKIAEPSDDLDGTPRRNRDRRRDSGCFAYPLSGITIILR